LFDCTAQCRRADRLDRAELQRAPFDDLAAGGLTMARNTVLRLLPLLPMTLLFGSLVGDPDFGYGVLFVGWGLSTLALGSLFVIVFGKRRAGRRYPSGGDL
jgi:hypothetical protein